MKTGVFEENLRYFHQINFDSNGNVEEKKESEFNRYVEKLKKEKGLI